MGSDAAQKLLKTISRTGMLEILLSLKERPKRFSEIMFDTQLNPGILDRHLKALLSIKLVVKDEENYRLSELGNSVLEKLIELVEIYERANV